MRPIITTVLIVILAWILYFLVFLLNVGRTVFPHKPDGCFKVEGLEVQGSEDIERLSDGTALVTSGLVFGQTKTVFRKNGHQGQIFLFDFKNPKKPAEAVKIVGLKTRESFNPHGITSWQHPKTGIISIMIVNHLSTSLSTVEIFEYRDKLLKHKKTVNDQLFGLLNDVIALDADSFYVTNYLYFRSHFLQGIETYLQLNLGQIIYFDGKKASVAQSNVGMPNGINLSLNKKYLYVSTITKTQINVYSLNADRTINMLKQEFILNTGADNLDVDSSGDVWTGAHPVIWKTLLHLKHPEDYKSPTQVIHITTNDGLLVSAEEVFVSNGEDISAGTIAVKHQDSLLIGSVFDTLLYCPLKKCHY